MKLRRIYFLFVTLALFSFDVFGNDRRVDDFYDEVRADITKLIRGYVDGNTALSDINTFMVDTRRSWTALYNNQNLQLTDDECGFWLVLWNTLPTFRDQEQEFFRANARFFLDILEGKVPINDEMREICKPWFNDPVTISMPELLGNSERYDIKILRLFGHLSRLNDRNYYLFMSKEHMEYRRYEYSVLLVGDIEIPLEAIGNPVVVSGRIVDHCSTNVIACFEVNNIEQY